MGSLIATCYLQGFLMRPLLDGGTLGGRNSREPSSRLSVELGREIRRRHICNHLDDRLGLRALPRYAVADLDDHCSSFQRAASTS